MTKTAKKRTVDRLWKIIPPEAYAAWLYKVLLGLPKRRLECVSRSVRRSLLRCRRCDRTLEEGYCPEATCPFNDHVQDCPAGWSGHDDHSEASEFCTNERCQAWEDRQESKGAK